MKRRKNSTEIAEGLSQTVKYRMPNPHFVDNIAYKMSLDKKS